MRPVRAVPLGPGCYAGRRVRIAAHLGGMRQHLAVLCLLPGSTLAQLHALLMVWQQHLSAYDTAIGICCLAYLVTLPTICKTTWRNSTKQAGWQYVRDNTEVQLRGNRAIGITAITAIALANGQECMPR